MEGRSKGKEALSSAERQRRYRERLKKNNPIKWEEIKKKEAEKKKQNYKKISELSETDKSARRKLWRKLKETKIDQDNKHKNTSRKEYKQIHYKITKENEKQKRKVENLKKKVDSLSKQLYRYKLLLTCQKENSVEQPLDSSPTSKTESFVQTLRNVPTSEINKVRKVVLEKNVLSEALSYTYKNCQSNAERNVLKKVIDNAVVREHRMKTRFEGYIGLKGRLRIQNYKKKVDGKRTVLSGKLREFYLEDDVSRATAGKKETKTLKKEKMQKRYLLDNLINLYKKFKQDSGLTLSYSTFIRNRPFFVVSPKLSDRDTCACKKHSNMEFKFRALQRLVALQGYEELKDLVQSLVCDPKSQLCMYSKCVKCKENTVKYDYTTTNINEQVSWLEWSVKDIEYKKNDATKTCKRMTKEIKKGRLEDLIAKFEQELNDFKVHLFNIGHQYYMYKNLKDNLEANEIILHCDFSENYTCKMHNEIQAIHFGASQFQISLHTSIVYQKNKKPQCYCTFSDSTNHSPEAIWAHLNPILNHITQKSPEIDTVHFFSDGPTTQYRQKKNFFLFNTIIKNFALTGTWNFFEASHGKGAADGVGGNIKRLLDKKVSHGHDVLDAESAFTLLKHDTRVKLFCIDEENIKCIQEGNKQTLLSLKAVPNTMKIHQIQASDDEFKIFSRILSCFCAHSVKRGFCDCFSGESHNLQKPVISSRKRARRIASSDESGNENCIPKKLCSGSKVTILSDVKVSYNDKKLRNILKSSRYNISSNNIKRDFKEMIITKYKSVEDEKDSSSVSNNTSNTQH